MGQNMGVIAIRRAAEDFVGSGKERDVDVEIGACIVNAWEWW